MTLVKQSESKQNLKLNKANSKTTQNVSNAKKNQNLHQITSIYPLFLINLPIPQRKPFVKISEKTS